MMRRPSSLAPDLRPVAIGRVRPLVLLASLLLGAVPPLPIVRVRLQTAVGVIVLALDARHAPQTTANFLRYVDDGRLDGTVFYRAARAQGRGGGFVEGGIGSDPRRVLPPVPLEPTSRTGLHHRDGAVSMARFDQPGSATGNFSILVGPNPSLDAHGRDPGFAVFGRVVGGMDVVKRILAAPAGGGSGVMRGQMLLAPVRIVHAQRLDGVAQPTGRPRPWLLGLP